MNKASAFLLAFALAIGLSAPGCAGGKAGPPPAPVTETVKITMTPVVREVPVLKSVTHDASADGISLGGAEPHILHVTAQGTPKLGGKTWLEGQGGAVADAPLRYDTARGLYEAEIALLPSKVPAGSYSVSAVLEKEGEEVTQIATASEIVRILPEAIAPAGIPPELRKEIEAFSAYFDTDDSTLETTYREGAQGLGAKLQPFAAQIRRIRVVGHCDARGSEIHNHELGQQRAASLAEVLSKSLDGVAIVTETLGSANPDPPGQDPAAWAKNRWARIQMEIAE